MQKKRIEKIAHFFSNESDKEISILDIGTDHALIPIYLTQNLNIKKIYATEINQKPYLNALNNIKKK